MHRPISQDSRGWGGAPKASAGGAWYADRREPMRDARIARAWIWRAMALEIAGLALDGVWHGLVSPGVEPRTFAEMLVHLGTVHLPLYLGVLSVLITTGWAFIERRHGSAVAFAGALLSAAAEAWHASIHVRLSTRGGPIAESVAAIGLLVVIAATWVVGRQERACGSRLEPTDQGGEGQHA